MTQYNANLNPLFSEWETPYNMPPFGDIGAEHFLPAFEAGFATHMQEIAAITQNAAPPSFENTIEALERSGRDLQRVSAVFFNLVATDTTDALQELEREITPRQAKHNNDILLNDALYGRVRDLFEKRASLELTSEQDRVLERYHTSFIRAGARLDEAAKARIGDIIARQAELSTQFAQNVLADESNYRLVLESESDLAGLPEFLRDAAARSAADLGLEGKHVITLSRSSVEPFLQFSEQRSLREDAYRALIDRGAKGGETDNRAIIAEILKLRVERAKLLGFDDFAKFRLDDTMAKTPDAVHDLLMAVWKPARARAEQERDALQTLMQAEGSNFDLQPWDWRYYSEKVRQAQHDLDEAEIKPYFQLDNMIKAAFDTAHKLFGISFKERNDLPTYHPDVRVWEVFDRQDKAIGLFCGDYFARPSKRGGAWMSTFQDQEKLDGVVRPIIVNVLNFIKASEGEPALLSFEDARTLFHEFGHGLHGLLSDVTYRRISGTSVDRDFVELPSQLYEHWVMQPETLSRYAIHAETGKAIPDDLLERLLAVRNFNQGFATVEYVSSAIVDLELHQAALTSEFDAVAFEEAVCNEIGMPREISERHCLPHFLHIFAGESYAAGYYSYLWSEVMDADAFRAFEEAGDIFHQETAERLYKFIYSAGGKYEPVEAYEAFRGRPPSIDVLLEKRGFKEKTDKSGKDTTL